MNCAFVHPNLNLFSEGKKAFLNEFGAQGLFCICWLGTRKLTLKNWVKNLSCTIDNQGYNIWIIVYKWYKSPIDFEQKIFLVQKKWFERDACILRMAFKLNYFLKRRGKNVKNWEGNWKWNGLLNCFVIVQSFESFLRQKCQNCRTKLTPIKGNKTRLEKQFLRHLWKHILIC